MKKRIFGTLLMGAMLVSSMSTFVSCKDYDDDINSLQTQINSLSSLLDTKEATINNTLNTIQAQLSSLSSLEATLKGQIADGDAATLAAARQAVADAQAALQAAINTNKSELVAANAAQDAAILEAKTAADQALAQLAQLSSTMQPLVESITKDIAAAQAGLTQVQLDLADLTAKYSTLNADLAQAILDIAELKTAVAGQAAALEAIGGQEGLAQVKADVATLLGNLTTLQGTVNALNAAQAQNAADIVGINTTLAALQAAQSNLADKAALDEVKSDLTAAQSKIDALDKEIKTCNTMIAALAKSLRSLVYMPYLYVDGIESIEYPYLWDVSLTEVQKDQVLTRWRNGLGNGLFYESNRKTIRDAASDEFPKLAHLYDWQESWKDLEYNSKGDKLKADDTEYFGPAWPVQYHMNPSRSAVAWENVKGWNVRKAEVITRSDAANGIKHTQFYADGTPVFNVNSATGVLTVGLQVDQPNLLANRYAPTEGDGRPGTWHEDGTETKNKDCQYDDIIALQVNTGGEVDTLVTSDYAMIYPEKAVLEGLVWVKSAKLSRNGTDELKVGNFDEIGSCNTLVHVWDTPAKALGAHDNNVYPDVELPYNDEICLKDYLGVHLNIEGNTLSSSKSNPHCIAFNEAEFGQWGLSYEFQLVGYSIDGNKTIDSNYAEFTDGDENGVSKTGTIRARNVKEDGKTIDTESQTSVDREPLVRVLVKRGNRVVLDGYILVHITRQESKIVVENYPEQKKTFDLCNAVTFTTDWSQFSYYVLTETMGNMTKNDFDAQYGLQYNGVPDLTDYTTPSTSLADGGRIYHNVVLYENTDGKVSEGKNYPGHVDYYYNANGTTNHAFEWSIEPNELEYYTHDEEMSKLPKTITKYIRYTGHAGAKYNHIYVKMTLVIDRATIAESGIKDKIYNYWFKADLSQPEGEQFGDDGWDAVVMNPDVPVDNEYITPTGITFNNHALSSFFSNGNKVQFTNEWAKDLNKIIRENNTRQEWAKFYFLPKAITITTQEGHTYTIAPKQTTTDEYWDAFVCKYWDCDYNNLHHDSKDANAWLKKHKWGTPEENKKIHEECAIDYNAGVYANNWLYVWEKWGTKDAVRRDYFAQLTQDIESGEIRLYNNDYVKEIINAVGYYDENHSNILDEVHTMVGVIGDLGCDVAVNIIERQDGADNQNAGTFYVSWQRPINVVEDANPMVDAKNNGDIIYTVDFLKLFDWRGPVGGAMSGANQWLWAYYDIKKLEIDTRSGNVLTNMHQSDPNKFVALSSITTYAQLGVLDENGTPHIGVNWPIDLTAKLAGKNQAAANANLLRAMGLQPVNNVYKQEFAGGLYYANNGDNVTEFDVIVPVTVHYGWGKFIAKVKVHIGRTLGN